MLGQSSPHNLPAELRPALTAEIPPGSGVFMRLGESYLSQVVYLGLGLPGSEDDIDIIGTGFFVFHDGAYYIVTAAHVAAHLVEVPFCIRLNKHADGRGQVVRLDSAAWHFHPDTKIDVAILPFTPPSWAKANAFPMGSALTDFKRETKKISPGDLGYVVGVFKLMPGTKRNNPVVHVGHLASWADQEEVLAEDWRTAKAKAPRIPIKGYLMQVRTMREASGSPVFIRRAVEGFVPDLDAAPVRNKLVDEIAGFPALRMWAYGSVWLLGLWHGAYADDIGAQLGMGRGTIELGSGMGLVIPAPRILEALDQPKLKQMRAKMKKAEAKSTPRLTPQSKPKSRKKHSKKNEVRSEHERDFNSLLGKAVRPPKQGD